MKAFDRWLLLAVVVLAVFGLVMMSSMSISASYELTKDSLTGPTNNFYFFRHMRYLALGVGAFFLGYRFPYESLKRFSPLIYLVGVALLIAVFVVGTDYNTAARQWLQLGPLPSLQPVEYMKPAIIVFFSAMFGSGKLDADTVGGGLLPFFIVLGVPAALIFAQPDLGSLAVLVLSSLAVYFAAGGHVRHILLGGMGGLLGVLGLIKILNYDYVLRRLMTFWQPEAGSDAAYQIEQALIAIGSGGVWGRGFQQGIQKFDYLPEVQSDTIFAAISEELGFVRIVLLLGLYLFIAYRGFRIARYAPDDFTRYLAVGLTTMVVGQAFANIAVNLALFPNTGITLPLISSGGSSLIFTLLSLGMLLHISEHVSFTQSKRWR
ncbi:FtsW/RodA/SpoVE family cell cycle protein [Candidatus Peribacteria bacterium]|nr:FtsW/RodA/SpoVE family cell cycle protein [Candidatus Peribacteria bacterium]